MISTMLVACSSGDLVPPGSIDTGTQVGAITPVRSLPREPVSQQAYPMNQAPVSQASAVDYGYSTGPSPQGDIQAGNGGQYLGAPDENQPYQGQGQVLGAPPSNLGTLSMSGSTVQASRLPMIDSEEAMQQQASLGRQRTTRAAAPVGPMSIPDEGVNIDAELGFGPDESEVTGLAEEQNSDIAEGVGDQPVVDGIGTDNPVALQPRRQAIAQDIGSDYVNVPPKRTGAGLKREPSTAGSMTWGDGSRVRAPNRAPTGTQQVAMLRPNNPTRSDAPMSQREQSWPREVMPQSEVSCRAELRRLGVEFEDRPRISQGGSCGIAHPVKLSGLSGNIDVKPAVTLNCQVTLAFAKWVKNELAPSARMRYLTGVKKIVPMGGYSCRRMNNSRQRNNPMSEHAKGNAIDIGQIVLKNGHEIDVRKKGLFSLREGGLLKSVRSDSCKYFNTVLGPGSNAEHWNHFHFDLRSRKSGKRHCSL
ncbi:extensin-like domain-containing protein [Neorhizobium turbinariae]